MALGVDADVFDIEFFQRYALNVEQRKCLVRADRGAARGPCCRFRPGSWWTKSPIVAAICLDLKTGAHVAARELLDMQAPLEQQWPEVNRQTCFAETGKVAFAESRGIRNVQAANAQLRRGGNLHFHRTLEAHRTTDVFAEGLRDARTQERRIDGNADKGHIDEAKHQAEQQSAKCASGPQQNSAQYPH